MNVPSGSCYEYQLVVSTGVWRGSGTTASVTIVIHGSEAQSEPITIQKHMTRGRLLLMRGNDDLFILHLPITFGTIQFLEIRHDNSGRSPSWFLRHIFIIKQNTGEKFTFICNRWFGLAEDDGKIERIVPAASEDDLKSFSYSFNVKSSKNLAEGHIWLSVVMKSPKDSFTRVQRSTCCLTLLLSSMLVNAMFYGREPHIQPTIQIGPLKMNWTLMIIGLQSCLVVTPINLLIAYIFKNTRQKKCIPLNQNLKKETLNRFCSKECCSKAFCCFKKNNSFQKLECDLNEPKDSSLDQGDLRNIHKGFIFPHWFNYVAWVLCFIVVAASASVTFFYSLQWGKTISNEWLSSMIMSFTEDLFVVQPIKVCFITVVLAYAMTSQKAGKNKLSSDNSKRNDNISYSPINLQSAAVNENDLKVAREIATKEKRMFNILMSL